MLSIYIDASTKGNPGPSGAGILIIEDGNQEQYAYPLQKMSNHEAEFQTLILALNLILEQGREGQNILIYSDSKTVVSTIDKNHTNNPLFLPYLENFQRLERNFSLLVVQWIPESKNKGADNLARQGLAKALKAK
ncbi:MAG: ribonuclease HI family protein [Lactobacillales bacterium]|jgi:ribonuclease HI|nr:ribonuclease HI family protein [Lactobacillales bacterium]